MVNSKEKPRDLRGLLRGFEGSIFGQMLRAATLALLLSAVPANAQWLVDGYSLQQACADPDAATYVIGFVVGTTDWLYVDGSDRICLPQEIDPFALSDAVCSLLEGYEDTEFLQETSGTGIVMAALNARYPCPTQ